MRDSLGSERGTRLLALTTYREWREEDFGGTIGPLSSKGTRYQGLGGVYAHFAVWEVDIDGKINQQLWPYIGSACEGWDKFLLEMYKCFDTRCGHYLLVKVYGLKGE